MDRPDAACVSLLTIRSPNGLLRSDLALDATLADGEDVELQPNGCRHKIRKTLVRLHSGEGVAHHLFRSSEAGVRSYRWSSPKKRRRIAPPKRSPGRLAGVSTCPGDFDGAARATHPEQRERVRVVGDESLPGSVLALKRRVIGPTDPHDHGPVYDEAVFRKCRPSVRASVGRDAIGVSWRRMRT